MDGDLSIIPGKFTLAFSMAPEFYRRVYKRNPNGEIGDSNDDINSKILSATTDAASDTTVYALLTPQLAHNNASIKRDCSHLEPSVCFIDDK